MDTSHRLKHTWPQSKALDILAGITEYAGIDFSCGKYYVEITMFLLYFYCCFIFIYIFGQKGPFQNFRIKLTNKDNCTIMTFNIYIYILSVKLMHQSQWAGLKPD